LKILIAESNNELAWTLAEELKETFEVGVAVDGDDAIRIVYSFRPDVLILDAGLHNKDGFFVLQTLQSAGIKPSVIMTTSIMSEFIVERAEQLQVKYVMRKPCDAKSILSAVYSLCSQLEQPEHTDRHAADAVDQLLLMLGFRASLKGYHYTSSAIRMLLQEPSLAFTKELYPCVARKFSGTWKQVERGIRLSITDAWTSRDERIWRLYFTAANNAKINKPSNSTFLCRMVECLRAQIRK